MHHQLAFNKYINFLCQSKYKYFGIKNYDLKVKDHLNNLWIFAHDRNTEMHLRKQIKRNHKNKTNIFSLEVSAKYVSARVTENRKVYMHVVDSKRCSNNY